MIKRITIFIFLVFALFACRPLYGWQIDDFKVNIDLNRDSSILVTEKIEADFSEAPKHGILRNLPMRYRDEQGNNLNLRFQILGVYDENGNPWQYSAYISGIYQVLKIGSPYQTYAAKKTFVIQYKVEGAVLYFENHDELFWNAIGTEWDCPIKQVTVNLSLPEPIKRELLLVTAYSGRFGSRSNAAEAQINDEEHITFKGGPYLPYEGLTIVVGWPKGIVEVVTVARDVAGAAPFPPAGGYRGLIFLGGAALFMIPLAVFLVMFNIWKRYGKDPQLQKSIVVEYKVPEGLTPVEMGTLIDDKIDVRDISATIIDLAIRGYLKIAKTEAMFFQKRYSFIKLKDFSADEALKPFEKIVLEGIFSHAQAGDSVDFSELENNFYKKLSDIKEEVFKQLMAKDFYKDNPGKAVVFYRKIGGVVLGAAFFLSVFFPLAVAVGLSGVIILAFAKYMPAKTKKGMEVYGRVLGFEEFLMRTDKEKIQYAQRQDIFEKMLPFAICLGISSQWANIFPDIYQQPPPWFSADYRDGFLLGYLMHDLNNSLNSMNTALVSMPRTVSSGGGFGGGGSSGGGFGGGGGSSW